MTCSSFALFMRLPRFSDGTVRQCILASVWLIPHIDIKCAGRSLLLSDRSCRWHVWQTKVVDMFLSLQCPVNRPTITRHFFCFDQMLFCYFGRTFFTKFLSLFLSLGALPALQNFVRRSFLSGFDHDSLMTFCDSTLWYRTDEWKWRPFYS